MVSCEREINHQGWELSMSYRESSLVGDHEKGVGKIKPQHCVTHSSILAWEILWTEEPGGLQSMGSQKKVRDDLATKQQQRTK